MQTFVPLPSFRASAESLDDKRLGKQRVECIQIVRALTQPGYGWANHPAVLMWKGYEEALGRYSLTTCEVWLERGYADTCAGTIVRDLAEAGVTSIRSEQDLSDAGELPPWLEDEAVWLSHQSALVRKDPEFYGERFPEAPPSDAYVWPVRSEKAVADEARKLENARLRVERAAAKAIADAEKARAKRSRAAKKAAKTRAANAKAKAKAAVASTRNKS